MMYHLFEVIAMEQTLLHHFARLIDHTNLHADATQADMKKLCDEAKKYHNQAKTNYQNDSRLH